MTDKQKAVIAKLLNKKYAMTSTYVNQSVDVDEYFSEVTDVKLLRGLRREALASYEDSTEASGIWDSVPQSIIPLCGGAGIALFVGIYAVNYHSTSVTKLINLSMTFLMICLLLGYVANLLKIQPKRHRIAHMVIKDAIEHRLSELEK